MEQLLITAADGFSGLGYWIERNALRKALFVCRGSRWHQDTIRMIHAKLKEYGIHSVFFSDFQPNPLYENVVKGVEKFRREECNAIIALGGGSAIDVAKCVKLFSPMDGAGEDGSYLGQSFSSTTIPFLAIPTTAGSGSEATRFAVIYYKGKKQSITSDCCVPDAVLLDPGVLHSLPDYQKKASMMDALCHGIESFWSVNSTDESRMYSREAIRGVLENMDGYLANTEQGNAGMLVAAHTAGKAINISQTTAGHAMCYMLTSLFGVAHGHAAILCDRVLYPWMTANLDSCIDPRGKAFLMRTLDDIGHSMGCPDAQAGTRKLEEIFERLAFAVPTASEEQYAILRESVNPVRLKNHPVLLTADQINALYHEILR